MPSRDPRHLHPETRILHARWEAACNEAGIEVLTTCTYRPQAEQDALYAQGRTTPGRIVTWTRKSRHSEKINDRPAASAWDFVVLVMGKAVWNAKHPHWTIAGEIAEAMGLTWGARFVSKRTGRPTPDYSHIQSKR